MMRDDKTLLEGMEEEIGEVRREMEREIMKRLEMAGWDGGEKLARMEQLSLALSIGLWKGAKIGMMKALEHVREELKNERVDSKE